MFSMFVPLAKQRVFNVMGLLILYAMIVIYFIIDYLVFKIRKSTSNNVFANRGSYDILRSGLNLSLFSAFVVFTFMFIMAGAFILGDLICK